MITERNVWLRPALTAVGLLAVYFGFPDLEGEPHVIAFGLVMVVLGLLLLGWTMITELGRLRHGEDSRGTVALAMLIVLLVIGFSATFFLLQRVSPDEFVGLDTRTDALYFTLSTMTTVGYGDVHAEGQVARILVCAAITFNIVVVASLVRAHTMRLSSDL